MGVIQSHQLADSFTPICNDCGVCLCYDISAQEYQDMQSFWDAWRCKDCDPSAIGSYLRERQNGVVQTK